jgi:hypothetical protein
MTVLGVLETTVFVSSVVSKHIQMLTPGLLVLLHLNIPSCLTSVTMS